MLIGTRLGPYNIDALLGAGGMGEVYRARDTKLDRNVAIKILPAAFAGDPELLARFEREARAVAALSHPNILAIHDFGRQDGESYAVMELLDGSSLREVMDAGPLPQRKAVEYAAQAAAGLAAAHEKGIVHRDLKPENLFLTRDGHVKILDFGLAAQFQLGDGDLTVAPKTAVPTSPGTILGTVGYMSPEQARGQQADHRADIFSLGCVLYEMLAGARAFLRDTPAETLTAILREDPPGLGAVTPPVTPALERLVLHCLEKRREDRFQSARDLAFALQALSGSAIVSGVTTRSGIGAPLPDVRPRGRFRGRAWQVGAAVGLAALGLAAGLMVRGPDSAQPMVRATRLTFDRGTIHSARFTPDGQTVVYGAAWGGAPIRIFQTRRGSPESTPLQLPDGDVLAVSSTGELAISPARAFAGWVPSGRLAQAPLVGGTVRDLLDEVRDADWSPDGTRMAIVRRVDGKDRLEYPLGSVRYETTGYLGSVRISPDGRSVAFMVHPVLGDNRGFVGLIGPDGTFNRLGPEWAGEEGVAWAPDGREVWFTAGNNPDTYLSAITPDGRLREIWRPPVGLVLLDIARDGRVLLTRTALLRAETTFVDTADGRGRDISWLSFSLPQGLSHDGRAVLFSRYDEGAGVNYQVGLRRIDQPGTVPLGQGRAIEQSPDGKWALAILPADRSTLTLLPTGAGEARAVSAPGFQYLGAAWLPDSQRLLVCAETPGKAPAVYLQDVAGGAPALVPAKLEDAGFSKMLVTPDGRAFVGVRQQGPPVLVQLSSGDTQALTALEGGTPIAVAADGRSIFAERIDPDNRAGSLVVRVDLTTNRTDVVQRISPADAAGLLGRPRAFITPDGRTLVYALQRYLTDLYLVEGLR
jgi:Tol biopolymer transport system component